MSKFKWLDDYKQGLLEKPDMGEIEWRFDYFKPYIIQKGLGYPSKLVRGEHARTDVRVNSPEGISHLVFETKIADVDLDKDATLSKATSYLQGGESFLILASPQRLRVFSPRGIFIEDIKLTKEALQDNATFWQLSYQYMSQKKHLEPFREGKFDYCYIPVHTTEGFEKFISALRLCGNLLLRHLHRAWQEHTRRYLQFSEKLNAIENKVNDLENLGIGMAQEELEEREALLAEEKARLKADYATTIDVMEQSFPAFCRIQPYSRDVEEKALSEIYLADITYAALNRLLFIRIAEDKGLLKRKISNGGIGVWRSFTTYLEDKYQDLIALACQDAQHIYEHFFEQGIFDWYAKGDSNLNEVLETILYLLNAFDLSRVDRDTLGDLYQAYLPPKERKRLGEFYTPREVIDYILRHIGWRGQDMLLDPACGSGGFLVRAANTMLHDMESRGVGDEMRLKALDRVIGLDINPFATHISEMNLLFLILDVYLRAKEQAETTGAEFKLGRIPIYTVDSLLGTIPGVRGKGTTRTLAASLVHLGEVEEAIAVRDKLGQYGYVVMNPPYVRNERLPAEPRGKYRKIFSDVVSGNADIFTYFIKKTIGWLKDESGKLGVIVSLSLADAKANRRLRKFLSSYTIEKVVPLEWCDVFVSNVNPILLFLRKAPPPQRHKIALVHGIRSLCDLDEDKGDPSYIPQSSWLRLAPDDSWRVEVKENDLPVLEKMKPISTPLTGEYGLALRTAAGGRKLVSDSPAELENPYPLLDGREVKAWSIEWQGRYIDYLPKLISDAKTLEFFKAPKVLMRLISLTTQAVVDEGLGTSYLARNTVMLVHSPVKELNDHPFVISALLNSLPLRYYSFLILRAGVVQKGYSHFYSGVINALPIPESTYRDSDICNCLDSLSQRGHDVAKEMLTGDRNILRVVDSLVEGNLAPFAHLPQSDLSSYFSEIDMSTTQVSGTGELTSSNLGIIKGHPAILQYLVARAALERREKLSKAAIETFLVPTDEGVCVAALEQMGLWAQKKPTLLHRLAEIQSEIDELVLSTFTTLTEREKNYVKERVKDFPLNKVLVADEPGVPTKRIPVKYWKTGARYKA